VEVEVGGGGGGGYENRAAGGGGVQVDYLGQKN
jgi:hypothetical protein